MQRLPHVLDRADVLILSLAAALLFAAGSVLEHHTAGRVRHEETMKLSLLTALVKRPVWVLAITLNLVAFGLQLLALRRGSLLFVQPLLVTGLLFALPMSAALAHTRPHATEWAGALAVVGGLALFLIVGDPDVGRGQATPLGWATIALVCGLPAAVLVRAGHCTHGVSRAAYLAAGAGILYGLTAALTKASAHLVDGGLRGVVTSWQPYALVALAICSLVVSQSAFQAGRLATVLPLLIIGEPVVAALIGVLAFHESVAHTPFAVAFELIGATSMAIGVLLLARSPIVLEAVAPAEV